MRVLMGMPSKASRGGTAACEPPFVIALKKTGIHVDEAVYVYGDQLTKTNLQRRISRVLRSAWRLRRRLQAERFDVLHLNTAFDTKALLRDVATLYLVRSCGVKIFLKMHGSDARLLRTRNFALRFLCRALFAKADGIGVLSSEEEENFIRAGANGRKLFVVKNAVAKNAHQRRPDFAERMSFASGTPLLLFAARFVPAKGLIETIKACRMVLDQGHDCALLCLGDGPLRRDAEREAARLGLQNSVRFFGYVPEEQAAEFYANSTLLVFPTYFQEGFPMVVFNSLAAGLPVITTRIRAAADYLQEPENCLWVDAKNPALLAERIIHILRQPQQRKMMEDNNRKLATKFAAENVAREYAALYEQLLRGEAQTPADDEGRAIE